MSIKSVDDLLITGTQAQKEAPEKVERETEVEADDAQEIGDKTEGADSEVEAEEESGSALEGASAAESPEIDDYGNEVPKARTYTEEEVQRMIRDRLSRGSTATATQAEVKKAAENFEADPSNPDAWETQLEAFVEKTLDKRAGKIERDTMEKQEKARQVEFETKFNSGMEKYKDFRDVVADKPITNAMMMAARNMKDPAAFIYAAAKTQAKELDRIARLPDAYAQALEIGKLDERMRKTRSAHSSAPPPVKHATGDVTTGKVATKSNIDARIHSYAKRKFNR